MHRLNSQEARECSSLGTLPQLRKYLLGFYGLFLCWEGREGAGDRPRASLEKQLEVNVDMVMKTSACDSFKHQVSG